MARSFTVDLGLRYGFGRQRSRFTQLVSLASMVGMVLGVASLITVLSVMNGFAGELRGRIMALVPHGYVIGGAEVDWDALANALEARDDIVATAPFLRETVLLSGNYRQQGAQLTGIDPLQQERVTPLDQYLLAGELSDLEEPFAVILGASLARALGVAPGDSLRVILPQITVTPLGTFPRSRRLTVVGLFEVGAQQDARLAYLSVTSLQRLLRDGGEGGLQLRTEDLWRVPALASEIAAALPPGVAFQPWNETQGSLFRAVRMEKLTVAALLLGVVLVAAFNIVATLVMAVAEKRGDIAVLRTMGATPLQIMGVFATQGLALAVLGIGVGAAAGVVLALNVDDAVAFLEQLFGARLFDPSVYFITRLPSELLGSDVLFVVVAALCLSVLAVLYPAWRAGRVAPAEVLRYE
jgi:lipoprotein-releasing system permease protein